MTSQTNLNPNSDCIVSAPVVERLPKCQLLYWYCRMLDGSGSGCASFTIKGAASDLGVSRQTINRWIGQCSEEHHGVVLFRSVARSYGACTVYYRSLIKVAADCNLEHGLGAIGRIMLKEFAYLREACTELEIDWLQSIAYYAHKKRLEKLAREENVVIQPSDIEKPFETSCKVRPCGKSAIIGDRYLCVASNFSFTGISQSQIAEKLGCSESTIKRRTSNKIRQQKDLPTIEKLQIARATDLSTENWSKLASTVAGDEGVELRRLFNVGNTVFRAEQNIYYLNVDLTQKRNMRHRYARQQNAA